MPLGIGKRRQYLVLPEGTALTLNGARLSLSDIFEIYNPALFIHPEIDFMRPARTFCECIENKHVLLINYFVYWRDEIHGNRILNDVYRVFRRFYYGSEEDIEFIQIGISRDNGEVVSFAFETDPSLAPMKFAAEHRLVEGVRIPGSELFKTTISGIIQSDERMFFEGKRIFITVAFWNHIYDFYRCSGSRMSDVPLIYLSDEKYSGYFMNRRSRPPLHTNDK